MEIELLLLSKQKRHWVSLLVYFNHFMAPKAIYTETLCKISSWAMDPPGPTLEPPMWLTDTFIPYLNDWEKCVQNRGNEYSKSEKNMMMLSQETRLGLRITGKYICTYYSQVNPSTQYCSTTVL